MVGKLKSTGTRITFLRPSGTRSSRKDCLFRKNVLADICYSVQSCRGTKTTTRNYSKTHGAAAVAGEASTKSEGMASG